jgi:hypothetical protein
MSRGPGIVMGNSTFSWWASYLSKLRNPKSKIVIPNRFTKNVNDQMNRLTIRDSQVLEIDTI